jgi:hypothetical protein
MIRVPVKLSTSVEAARESIYNCGAADVIHMGYGQPWDPDAGLYSVSLAAVLLSPLLMYDLIL